jgi:hypothetical protein
MPPSILANALFASYLQPSDRLTAAWIREAVRLSLHVHGGEAGCAAVVAAEYGEHPETAGPRMRWALALAAATADGPDPAAVGAYGTRPALAAA